MKEVKKGQPLLQVRTSYYGPDDGLVYGPFQNIEFLSADTIGVQRPGEEDWEDLDITGPEVVHVFVEPYGTEPMNLNDPDGEPPLRGHGGLDTI